MRKCCKFHQCRLLINFFLKCNPHENFYFTSSKLISDKNRLEIIKIYNEHSISVDNVEYVQNLRNDGKVAEIIKRLK
jgi:hypothetical protein